MINKRLSVFFNTGATTDNIIRFNDNISIITDTSNVVYTLTATLLWLHRSL